MKNKKLITALCATALIMPVVVGLTGCSCSKKKNFNINAKDVYALSAVSSVNYLKNLEGNQNSLTSRSLLANEVATSRPANITEENVEGMKNCLTMFDSVLQGGNVEQDTNKNTETNTPYASYNFVMSITLPGTTNTIKMYYDEINTRTNVELDDENEELETSSTLQGVMVMDGAEFLVEGKREFEKDGDETEASIEFTTKSKTNNKNYIVVEQSVENEDGEYEIEYEYKIYENGVLVQETETELENEDNKLELKFKLKVNGVYGKTVYKLTKGTTDNTFEIKYLINGTTDKITVEETTLGYTFTYSNGYTETVNI